MLHRLMILLTLCFGLSACQKRDDTAPDPVKVIFSVSSPREGQQLRTGDTLRISAEISYPSELHGYEVRISDSATGNILYDNTQHVHTDRFVIADQWICTAAAGRTLLLSMITHIDHAGNTAQLDRYLRVVSSIE